jgi:SH3 domain protein
MHNLKIIIISILSLLTYVAQAETIYVIDELKIGLHEKPTVDSPILKLVNSGAALTVIERKESLIHVEEAGGTQGWINNKYVVTSKPAKTRVVELEKEIELLQSMTTVSEETDSQNQIAQLLKSERLKSGELQAKLTDLKAKIANADDSEHLLIAIEQLKLENAQLITQLESSSIGVQAGTNSSSVSAKSWKQCLTTFIIIFIIGMVLGAFVLDFLNRRKHGGFRI